MTKQEFIDKWKVWLPKGRLGKELFEEICADLDAVISGSGENHVDDERALEPIQDAIYATGRFTTADCDKIANGIIDYLRTAGMNIYKSPNS